MKRLTRVELECDNEATSQLAINLSRRPYLDRRIILRTPPNNFPRFLYKYLGPGLKDEWLRDILIDSKLYLRSPTDFNDPFDMRGHIIDELNIRKKRDYLEAMIKQMAPHLTWKQRNSHLNRLMVDTNLFEKLKKSLITVVKNHGISCFSIKPRSILMWSHYG